MTGISRRHDHVRAHDLLDCVTAQPMIAIANEDRIGRRAAALGEPVAEHLGAVLADRCCPLLAPFAHAPDVRARAEHDIAARQADQLRDA